jgi:hypothetical protein
MSDNLPPGLHLDLRPLNAMGIVPHRVKLIVRPKVDSPEAQEKLREAALFNLAPDAPSRIIYEAWVRGLREVVVCGVECTISTEDVETKPSKNPATDIAANLPFAEERARLVARLREIDKAQNEELDRRLAALEEEHEREDVAGQPDPKF